MQDTLHTAVCARRTALIDFRRHFHQHPELSTQEHRTAATIATHLRELGLEVVEGVADTGVVALLRGIASGNGPGRTALIRADIDALPVDETGDVPYRSQVPGVMHACGHDGHIAMALVVSLDQVYIGVYTTDPLRLPVVSTWYLVTNLPLPDAPPVVPPTAAPRKTADLAEVVRLYGLRMWVEQSYKHVKQELGWADFQVRSDRAIRRHCALVCCAFAFGWWIEFQRPLASPVSAFPAASRSPFSREPGAGEKSGAADTAERCGLARPGAASWPLALRHVHSWLAPWHFLYRCWVAWSDAPPPVSLHALLTALSNGQPLYLYLRL